MIRVGAEDKAVSGRGDSWIALPV